MNHLTPLRNGGDRWRLQGTVSIVRLIARLCWACCRYGNIRVAVTSYQRLESVGNFAFFLTESRNAILRDEEGWDDVEWVLVIGGS